MRRLWLVLGFPLATTGCYTGLSARDDGGDGADDGASSPVDGDGSATADDDGVDDDGDSGDDGPDASCETPQVGATPLRRLTRVEYDNTVRDLLGDTTRPAHAGFSPDEESGGFAANSVAPISAARLDQYVDAAESLAATAVEDLQGFVGCAPADEGCIEGFVADFGRDAFRRPLTETEVADYVALYDATADEYDARTGVRLVVQAMLLSPHFLYHVEALPPGAAETDVVALAPFELASRLSYFVWASMPDDALLAAAEDGTLADPEVLEAEVRRMLDDDRAADAIASFHEQWLQLGELDELTKDTTLFAGWTPELGEAMEVETASFADEVIRRGDGRLQTLLTASWTIADGDLAALYGVGAPDESGRVELDPAERSGLLTSAGFLASKSHAAENSWVHRGKFVRESLLCSPLPPPPPGVEANEANDPGRLENPECNYCHLMMDPIGVGFENYDAIGAFRTVDAEGNAIDAQGEVVGVESIGTFVGAVELAHELAADPSVHDCVALQWMRYAGRREDTQADACAIEQVRAVFAESDQDVRELVVAVVLSDAFRYRTAQEVSP